MCKAACIILFFIVQLTSGEINRSHDRTDVDDNNFQLISAHKPSPPDSMNSILVKPRFKCYVCESPGCDSVETASICHDAIQCWKSRVRDTFGVETVSRGCTTVEDHLPLICNQNRGPRKRQTTGRYSLECCTGNFCNNGSFPTLTDVADTVSKMDSSSNYIKLVILWGCGMIVAISTFASIVFCVLRQRQRKRLRLNRDDIYPDTFYSEDLLKTRCAGESTLQEFLQASMTSGSGSGLPLLIQKTICKNVELKQCIGKGRYGEVWRGIYQDEPIAVKIFVSRDEESFKRETEIYSTISLRHENILGYIASDVTSRNSCTQMWLLTYYYPRGSLFDYLNRHALTLRDMGKICSSVTAGLFHLHSEILGIVNKPSIAHRDLKSKNILVGPDCNCVIADFGLAVTDTDGRIDHGGNNPRVGTKRYMAPEVLDGSINMNCIAALKGADIYALGLMFWEVCRRTLVNGIAEEYKVPYYDVVPADPSFEDMKKIVCVDNYRPSIPNRWSSDDAMYSMSKLIRECWHHDPRVRPTALRVKKTLSNISQKGSSEKMYNKSEDGIV